MKALVLKDEQFVTDANGKRVGVLLDVKTYEHLRDAEEELADIRTYDAARPQVTPDLKAGRLSTLADYRARRSDRGKKGTASFFRSRFRRNWTGCRMMW